MRTFSLPDSKNIPLDYKLDAIFKKNNGFFIELGANDGISQSNTAFFEFFRGWKGLLIEPSIDKYKQCITNRPNSIVKNYACVDNHFCQDHIYGDFNGSLMASVQGERLKSSELVIATTITLEKLLDNYSSPQQVIDFLSLDTEGYELPILKGLNLNKYRPRYMLIEIYTKDFAEIVSFLLSYNYILLSNFSNYSLSTNPNWDGTHNDYLFADNVSV